MKSQPKKVYHKCGQCSKLFCEIECPHCVESEVIYTPSEDSMFSEGFFEKKPGYDGIYYEEESLF
jgi:hypothetical protein